jgi:protein-tyrosine phosphatase
VIDLHCHLLPGIDDGPDELSEALALARHAVKSGIHTAVVTPHMQAGRYENRAANIRLAVDRFADALKAESIPLRLLPSAEVRLDHDILEWLSSDQVPFLGAWQGDRLILLEFPHSHIPVGSDKLVAWLLKQHIRPMIAHPERNKDVLRNVDKIAPYVEMGCLLQVTAGSIAGNFGLPVQERAADLLRRGWVTILASDAHNLEARPPELEPGRRAAAKLIGEAASWELVLFSPARIIGLTL